MKTLKKLVHNAVSRWVEKRQTGQIEQTTSSELTVLAKQMEQTEAINAETETPPIPKVQSDSYQNEENMDNHIDLNENINSPSASNHTKQDEVPLSLYPDNKAEETISSQQSNEEQPSSSPITKTTNKITDKEDETISKVLQPESLTEQKEKPTLLSPTGKKEKPSKSKGRHQRKRPK